MPYEIAGGTDPENLFINSRKAKVRSPVTPTVHKSYGLTHTMGAGGSSSHGRASEAMSPVVAGQTLADRIMFPEPTPGSASSSSARSSPKASRQGSKLRKHATGGSTRRRASQVGRMMPELEKQMNSQECGAGGRGGGSFTRSSGAGAGAGAASAPFVFGSREGSVSLSWDAEQSNAERMGTKMASLSSTFIAACRNAERKHGGGTRARKTRCNAPTYCTFGARQGNSCDLPGLFYLSTHCFVHTCTSNPTTTTTTTHSPVRVGFPQHAVLMRIGVRSSCNMHDSLGFAQHPSTTTSHNITFTLHPDLYSFSQPPNFHP